MKQMLKKQICKKHYSRNNDPCYKEFRKMQPIFFKLNKNGWDFESLSKSEIDFLKKYYIDNITNNDETIEKVCFLYENFLGVYCHKRRGINLYEEEKKDMEKAISYFVKKDYIIIKPTNNDLDPDLESGLIAVRFHMIRLLSKDDDWCSKDWRPTKVVFGNYYEIMVKSGINTDQDLNSLITDMTKRLYA